MVWSHFKSLSKVVTILSLTRWSTIDSAPNSLSHWNYIVFDIQGNKLVNEHGNFAKSKL